MCLEIRRPGYSHLTNQRIWLISFGPVERLPGLSHGKAIMRAQADRQTSQYVIKHNQPYIDNAGHTSSAAYTIDVPIANFLSFSKLACSASPVPVQRCTATAMKPSKRLLGDKQTGCLRFRCLHNRGKRGLSAGDKCHCLPFHCLKLDCL